ncbi:MAG: hypothetical protein HYX66_07200 [Ignavibacteria bacterium]|nr:hypothetical protein [Ignavibacteria bacterium]
MVDLFDVDGAPPAIGPYSHAALCQGNVLYLSGQIALDAQGTFIGGDAAVQTRQIFANISIILAARGLQLSDIAKTTVYLTSMDDFGTMNIAYSQALGSHKPVRTTIEVSGLPKGARVEIEVVACIN